MGEKGVREEYMSIVGYVSLRGSVSMNRARVILARLMTAIQDAARRGEDIHIPKLFRISYMSRENTIYNNTTYGLEEQIKDVAESTRIKKEIVEKVINLYYRRILELAEIGYHVNVRGVGYIMPKGDSNGVYCDTRVSPVLSKPERADYLILGEDGDLEIREIEGKDLRYSIELEEDFRVPYKILGKVNTEIREVEI